jgi:hypothetical protein
VKLVVVRRQYAKLPCFFPAILPAAAPGTVLGVEFGWLPSLPAKRNAQTGQPTGNREPLLVEIDEA